MKDSQIPVLNEGFKLEKFDNEVLLYSVSDTRAVYLNDTAYLVYGICSSGRNIGEIIALLEDAYPEDKAAIRGDVILALKQLVKNGAVVLND
ncbi:MAG: PqqD family protein [Desulforhopalus sp.]|nr:PqqD family protein [Desulforhopalus sp.]